MQMVFLGLRKESGVVMGLSPQSKEPDLRHFKTPPKTHFWIKLDTRTSQTDRRRTAEWNIWSWPFRSLC